jgi:methionyl-tRNA formyltransferase
VALASHQVVAVVSQPDRPKGRSGKPTPPPVVEAARALGLSAEHILQPPTINEPQVLSHLKSLAPDLLCVIAYGDRFKNDALALPRLCAINAHASLLPMHRGAAPIQAALLAGDPETGVSIMRVERGLDKGPVMLQRALPILPTDDAGTLHDKLAALSANCCVLALEQLAAGTAVFTPQDDARASYAGKLHKDSGRVDWTKDAAFLERFVRAMNPWPGAWTSVSLPDGSHRQRVRIATAGISPAAASAPAGSGRIVGTGEKLVIAVACSKGALAIMHLQPEAKRTMTAAEFIHGAGRAFAAESRWE